MNPIRLVLAYDSALLRAALRLLLDKEPGLTVVTEADSGASVQNYMRYNRPDVVVMSISARTGMGTSLIEWLVRHLPSCRVVALSPRDEASFVRLLISAGAAAYVCEQSPPSELFAAIREAAYGRTYIDQHVASRGDWEPLGKVKVGQAVGAARRTPFLSRRETEVLKLLARGYTNQQVADTLTLSVKTAETYRVRLTRKLGVKTRAELFRYAYEVGMIGPDQIPGESMNDTVIC
jgi:two-component system, NarL family, response regulator NreC